MKFAETVRRLLLIPSFKRSVTAAFFTGGAFVPLQGSFVRAVPSALAALLALAAVGGVIGWRLGTIAGVVDAAQRRRARVVVGGAAFGGLVVGAMTLGGLDRRFGLVGAVIGLAASGGIAAWVWRSVVGLVDADVARLDGERREAENLAELQRAGKHIPMLSCRGLNFSYGQLQVLFDVDFTVDDGEMVALLGTNGAGKSTLLKVVSGIGLPSAGTVRFRGADITYLDAERRVPLGITQTPGGRSVFGPLDVVENLRAFGYTLGKSQRSIDAAIEECFEVFPRLRERKGSLAATLSGGEQQMVGLSKALILQPQLLLIDELSLGLAPIIVGQLLDTVRRINASGTAVVLVEQSVNIALSLVEHAYFMEKGEMRFDGKAKDLMARDDLLRAVFLEGASKATQ